MTMIGLSPSGQSNMRLAEAMLSQAQQPRPINSHWEGIGQLAQALSGAYRVSELNRERDTNLSRMAEILAQPDGLSSPELAQTIGSWAPDLALSLAGQNRAYDLQRQQFDLERSATERELAAQQGILDAFGGAGGMPAALFSGAVLDNDYGAAHSIWEATPSTYGQPGPGAPAAPAGAPTADPAGMDPTQSGTLIPPEPASRTPQQVGAEVYNGAIQAYGRDVIETAINQLGMPGIDGLDPEEWTLGLHVWLQNNNIDPVATRALRNIAQGIPTEPSVQSAVLPPVGFQSPPPAPAYGAPTTPVQAQGATTGAGQPGGAADAQAAIQAPDNVERDAYGRPAMVEQGGRSFWRLTDGSLQPIELPPERPYTSAGGTTGESLRIIERFNRAYANGDPLTQDDVRAYALAVSDYTTPALQPDGSMRQANLPAGFVPPEAVDLQTRAVPQQQGPTLDPATAREARQALSVFDGVAQAIDNYENIFDTVGGASLAGRVGMFQGAEEGQLATGYTQLMLALKDLAELGAITGPDLEILQSIVDDPRSLWGIANSDDFYRAQLAELRRNLDMRRGEVMQRYGQPTSDGQQREPDEIIERDPVTGQLR